MRPTPKSPEQWQREADHDRWVESARRVTTREAATRMGWRPRHEAKRGWISGPCPMLGCGGTDRFSIALTGHKAGGFKCRQCGLRGGDGIALLMTVQGMAFLQAVETLAGPPPHAETSAWTEEKRAAWRARCAADAEKREADEAQAAEQEAMRQRRVLQSCSTGSGARRCPGAARRSSAIWCIARSTSLSPSTICGIIPRCATAPMTGGICSTGRRGSA